MRKRGTTLISAALAALVLLAIIWLSLEKEPATGGKTLAEWSQQYGSNHWSGNRVADREAQIAIRKIGTNAIPFLLHQIAKRDSAFKRKLQPRLPKDWQNSALFRFD